MAIYNTQVQTVATSIFVAESQQAITTMFFCNVTTVTQTLDLFAVPPTAGVGLGTQILNNVVLAPQETFSMDSERLILEKDEALYAIGSSDNGITVTISAVSTT